MSDELPFLELLPLALGITVNPIPAIVAIVLLQAGTSRWSAVAALGGWLVGLTGVTILAIVVAESAYDSVPPQTGLTLRNAGLLLVGAALVILGLRKWLKQRGSDQPPVLPGWMDRLGRMTAAQAAGSGLVLAVVNPKHIGLALGAGAVIGSAAGDPAAIAVALVAFVGVASLAIAVPVVYAVIAGASARPALDRWHAWLMANHSALLGSLLVVIGGALVLSGLRGVIG